MSVPTPMADLPLVSMFKIYNYLSLQDRISASQACIAWRYAYGEFKSRRRNDRRRFRSYSVSIGTLYNRTCSVRTQLTRIRKDVRKRTHLIKHINMNLGLSRTTTRKHHSAFYATLIKTLKYVRKRQTRLTTLNIRSMNACYLKDNWERWNIVWAMVKTLQKQPLLTHVCLREAKLPSPDVRLLFYALREGCKDVMRSLDIVNVAFIKPGRIHAMRHAFLDAYLPRYVKLVELRLNFEWMTPQLLDRVTRACVLLEYLGLEVFKAKLRNTLTITHWQAAMIILPKLCLHIYMRAVNPGAEITVAEMVQKLPIGQVIVYYAQ